MYAWDRMLVNKVEFNWSMFLIFKYNAYIVYMSKAILFIQL